MEKDHRGCPKCVFIFVQSFSYLHKLDLPSPVSTYPGGSGREARTLNSIFVLHPKVLS